jgi:hypothetical protein
MAGELGVGVLGTTLLSPVEFMAELLKEYEAGLQSSEPSPYRRRNEERGVFTFVHVAETRDQAIRNGAALAALWYVHAAPIIFKVPRSIWYDAIRSGLHPNSPDVTAALKEADQTSLEITADEVPVVGLLKRMALGEEISPEQAHEICESLDSVIIGDIEHCRQKMLRYRDIGCTRLMCLMQFGQVPHDAVLNSIRLCGEHLVGRL